MIKTIDECFSLIQNGANIKQGDVDGGFPITRIETITNDKFNRDRMGYAGITDISKYTSYLLEDGDLLMSHINSVQYLGRTVMYVKQSDETIIHGMNLLRLKARRDVINPAYAKYCFYGHPFRSQIRKITKKSVNQASFAVKDLKQIKLNIPTLSEQNEIVMILDKIQQVLALRIDELSKLDDLIKARFVEMFENREYNVVRLGDVCTKITDGMHKTPNYLDDGITFISAKNIVNGELDFSNVKYISEDEYMEIQKRCQTEKYDILLSKSGSLGTPVIVKTEEKIGLFESLAVIKYDRTKLIPEFLCEQLKTEKIQRQFKIGTKGVAIKHLHLGVIADIRVIVPDLEKQKEFADFVRVVDKSKVEVQKALDKTQMLFDSLMQQYFG